MTRIVPALTLLFVMQTPIQYPETRKDAIVEDHFGTKIADPYRWLEDDNSADTKAWVRAQNAVTFKYLESIPMRDRIKARLTELWTYEKYGTPTKQGPWFVFSRMAGADKQPIVYRATNVNAPPARENILIDPHVFDAAGKPGLKIMNPNPAMAVMNTRIAIGSQTNVLITVRGAAFFLSTVGNSLGSCTPGATCVGNL